MSDSKIIGYAYYVESDEIEDEDRTVCKDCADKQITPDGMKRASIRDSDVYGNEVPYPECNDCGEVMRPWIDVRKKPVDVEAKGPFFDPTRVETLEGDFDVDGAYVEEHGGYYIIRGVHGEKYPCGADIFEETYEVVDGECEEGDHDWRPTSEMHSDGWTKECADCGKEETVTR